jgi:hypothetical protein
MAVTAKRWAELKADPVKMEAHRQKMRKYRKNYHEAHTNTHGDPEKQRRRRVARNRRVVDSAYATGCALCSMADPDCMECHHLDPNEKEFAISQQIYSATLKGILAELAKCVVLCANCHKKTHARLGRNESTGLGPEHLIDTAKLV